MVILSFESGSIFRDAGLSARVAVKVVDISILGTTVEEMVVSLYKEYRI